jgi:hypothetical protein
MLYLFTLAASFVVPIVLMVAMVWSETKRWTYRLIAVPVITLAWAGVMVYAIEADAASKRKCRDTWAYRYGGRACR